MKTKNDKTDLPNPKDNNEKFEVNGYPVDEDIYNRDREEKDIDPEDPSKKKVPNDKPGTMNEKNSRKDLPGNDLDIPGSEDDDEQEDIGSEDEENNYYSLGGDDHNDLEEENE